MIYSRKSIIKKTRYKKVVAKGQTVVRKVLIIFIILLFVMGILAWQSGNEKVVISEISVSGNEIVKESDIQESVRKEMLGKYLWLFRKDNIFIYPKGDIEEAVFAIDKRIRALNIHRDSLTSVAVEIFERKPEYVWCESKTETGEKCFFMDELGYIFVEAPQFSGSVFFTFYTPREFNLRNDSDDGVLGNQLFEISEFEKFIAFKKEVEKIGFETIGFVEKEENDFELLLTDDSKIIFNEEQNFDDLLENLDSSIDTIQTSTEPLEYIDLRFGNKVFYKFID
ncbi:cell division protein FtsQ/DivIB [Patescibacteria group bacterium]